MDRHYYKINDYLLSAIGQWPYQTKFKSSLFTASVIINGISLLIVEIAGLVKVWGNIDSVIDCISPLFFNLVSIICFIASVFKKEKMMLIFSKIKRDWSDWTSGPELQILRDYARQGRKFVFVYSALIYINTINFYAVPLMTPLLDIIMPLNQSRTKRQIFAVDYLTLDMEDNYYWIALHTCVSKTLLMTVIVSVDSIFIVLLYHACGELAILRFKLMNLVKEGNRMSTRKIQQEVKFCVEKHKSIILFVNDISDYFSTAYFFILGINMLMMSITGVQTVINLNKPNDAYTYAVFALGQMFHLFCLTVPCQNLMDHSMKLSENIYDGHWYEIPSESQKLLLMIMMKNRNPCSFIVGRLYTLSMQNFASIVQTSMSYFTVLLSVRDK